MYNHIKRFFLSINDNGSKKITATLVFVFLLTISSFLHAELINIDHYSVKDGLSENTVVSMFQDRKGNMWFGTFAGLNRFDGYQFSTYKAEVDSKSGLSHNRVDYITEDSFGFLWLITYTGEVQRFNPKTEEFLRVPDNEDMEFVSSPITKLYNFSSGEIWLATKNSGAFRVLTNPVDFSLKIDHFGKNNQYVNTDFIHSIYKDWQKNVWLMSDNGLIEIPHNKDVFNHYFENSSDRAGYESQAFYCATETDIEILFGSSNGRVWIYNKQNKTFLLQTFPVQSNIIEIKALPDDKLLILTSDDGFVMYSHKDGVQKHYTTKNSKELKSDKIISVYIDYVGEVWLETYSNGVTHFNPKSGDMKFFSVKTDKTSPHILLPNYRIFEDKNNRLWVHPRGGGFSYYDRSKEKLMPFYNEPDSRERKFSNLIHSAMSDVQGNLWMCTYSKGLEKISFRRSEFEQILPNENKTNGLYENEVRALLQDSDTLNWIATKDGTLYILDKNMKKLGTLGKSGRLNQGDSFGGIVYAIHQDSKGRIWLGTKGDGIYLLEKNRNSKTDFKVSHYIYNPDDIYSLSHNAIYSFYEDADCNIWVGTFGGGLNLVDQSRGKLRFISHRNSMRSYPITKSHKVRKIAADNEGNIWLATSNGVVNFKQKFDSPANIEFNYISEENANGIGVMSYDVHYIYKSQKGDLFFATYGGGLNKLTGYEDGKPVFKNYSQHNGAPSDIILNITEDRRGNLWMSSENGLLQFNTETEQFNKYDINDGLDCEDFSESSIINLVNNRIGVGTNKGMYVFDPAKLRKKEFVPPIIFTDFQLFNQSVKVNSPDSPLKEAIDYADKITLDHNQSVFTICFAALDMENTNNLRYQYRLNGADSVWINLTGAPRVTYTNLPKGKYVFEVRSTNADGVWVNNARKIDIEVLPSFWESNYGYLLYLLGFAIFLAIIFYIQYIFIKLKNKVVLEQNMSNLKLRFFTDISHELRTPLTLIASPIEYMIKNEKLEVATKEQLKVVQRNVDRMLRLVNQILDFRKIQNNKMKMNIEHIVIGEFTTKVCENFMSVATDKDIKFRIKDNTSGLRIWADKDKVEKILFNLLANAFKFTPSGKEIEVEITSNNSSVSIRIQDEGIGMSREKLSRLFERFDSADNYEGFQPGTGIGLSLTKELIDMHKATIIADSIQGKGTWFTVTFLLGTKHYEGNVDFILEDGDLPEVEEIKIKQESDLNDLISDKQTILIVEDNSDLRSFLKTVLEQEYRVLEASNGSEGILSAFDNLPDIIISDVMMPDKDGLQLTETLKNDIRTSHTPVILLTAKTAMEDKLAALNSGADDYITKPFSAEYLEARIKNMLAQRQKLQEVFCNNLSFNDKPEAKKIEVAPSVPQVASQDDLFIESLIRSLEENMENSELTVDDLVSMAGLSRSVFFKKLKSLTGLAPIEFIREMRIKRAAQLIETRQYNISQIAYMVGMNDPRYFSRCFKQKFGMTPTEYKEKYSVGV